MAKPGYPLINYLGKREGESPIARATTLCEVSYRYIIRTISIERKARDINSVYSANKLISLFFFPSFIFFFIKAPAYTQARAFLCVRKIGHEFFLRHYLSAKAHPCFPIMAYLTHQPPAHSLSLLGLRIAHRSPR